MSLMNTYDSNSNMGHTIDLVYRPPPMSGPIWVAPDSGLGRGWGDSLIGPRRSEYQRELDEQTQRDMMEALRRFAEQGPITITGDSAPTPAQAAPAAAPEPEGVDTTDNFRPQRKLDLD